MAEVLFMLQNTRIDGIVLRASGLTTSDATSTVTINEGNADVTVHLYGTVGGATVAVLGGLVADQLSVLDDAYGVPMSYTTLGIIKPIGPAVTTIRITVTGGTGVSVGVDVYIVRKAR